jgi:signal transduction histidine kinase
VAVRERSVAKHRNGLSGFEPPRYLHVDTASPEPVPASPTGEVLRFQAFLARSLIGVVLIAVAPTLHQDQAHTARFGWLVAAVWLPGVGILDLLQRRYRAGQVAPLALFWDLALFVGVEVALDAPDAAALGFLLVTAFHAYIGGRRRAWFTGGLALLAMLVAPLLNGGDLVAHRLTVELIAGTLLVLMLADAAHRQDASRAGLVQMSGKADAILASIASEVIVTSPSGRVREWNPAAARTFGCHDGPSSSKGARCADVLGLHIGIRQLRCEEGCALLDLSPTEATAELWRLDRHGHRQPLLGSASPVVDQDGVPVEIVHSFRDITSIRAADEAKTLFLATASHELKTPLTVIRGFAQMLQLDGVPEDKQAHAAVAIEARADQLAGIVDRLLMSSRIDAGRIDLDLDLIDLAPIMRDRAHAIELATNRTVVIDIGTGLPLVFADPDAVTTVVDHLLDNAVKYSPDGGSLALSARRDPTAEAVILAVADRGIGMTPEQVERCFERFWQAESSDVRRFAGSGIGLYIVRSLVEGMGGRVSVTSSVDEWTVFSCTLRTNAPIEGDEDDPVSSDVAAELGQASMIREYMRLVGVPLQRTGDQS